MKQKEMTPLVSGVTNKAKGTDKLVSSSSWGDKEKKRSWQNKLCLYLHGEISVYFEVSLCTC